MLSATVATGATCTLAGSRNKALARLRISLGIVAEKSIVWRDAGSFATLLYLGYGVLFMVVGRDDNFYWGAMIAPTTTSSVVIGTTMPP